MNRQLSISLGVLVATVGASFAGWTLLRQGSARALHHEMHLLADQVASRVQYCVDTRLDMIEMVSGVWWRAERLDARGFSSYATVLIDRFNGYQAISLIDAGGRIIGVNPAEGNEAALGKELFAHPVAGRYLRTAMTVRETTLTEPLTLYQGGQGFATYIPLVSASSSQVAGFVNVVFRNAQLMQRCLGESKEYALSVRDNGVLIYRFEAEEAQWDHGAVAKIQLRNRTWAVTVAPLETNARIAPGGATLAMAFVVSVALAVLAFLLLSTRARAAETRLRLEAELNQARMLEAVGRLAGGVAHDFNNLLTVVLGNAGVLLMDADTDSQPLLEDIVQAAEHASRLTEQLLGLGSRHANDSDVFDAGSAVHVLSRLFDRLLPPEVSLEVDVAEGAHRLVGQPSWLEQILVNLVMNASQAMPDGGVVRMSLRREGDELVLVVSDSGAGMDEATLRHMYEPFFTTKAVGGGTGLGLATVHAHTRRLGGTISVSSVVGSGTRFEVRLPVAAGDAAGDQRGPGAGLSRRLKPGAGKRVLIVDDDLGVRRLTWRIIHNHGFDVAQVGSGSAAKAWLEDNPAPDLIITDLAMPDGGGGELIAWLRAERSALPVLVVSGYADRADAGALAGVMLLRKPFTPTALLEAIDKVLR